MNQTSHAPAPSTPASSAEIGEALKVLFNSLPFQRGTDPETVVVAYVEALRGVSLDGIKAGISKFLRGDCENVSMKFVPTPPELARIVRTAVVPARIPEERRIAPFQHRDDGERMRMRLKMPLYNFATATGRMDELARALDAGFGATAALAAKWGIPIPAEFSELSDQFIESEWRAARNRAQMEVDRNPPPYVRQRQKEAARRSDLPIIMQDASFEDFKRMSKAHELPAGASWVASTNTIYGPRPVRHRAAA